MIKERLINKIISYGKGFSAYAWLYQTLRRGTVSEKPLTEKFESIDEFVRAAENMGAVFYGRELLNRFGNAPSNTILFVSHQLSLSGAPIALLKFASVLYKKGWQVLIVSHEDGRLGKHVEELGIPAIAVPGLIGSCLVTKARGLFSAIIACTLISAPIVYDLAGTDTPVLWWIHEAAIIYNREKAEEFPRRLQRNVHIYCGGEYAQRVLESRFPRYKTDMLLYCANDAAGMEAKSAQIAEIGRRAERIFACVAMVEWRKGQDILLEAVEHLSEEILRNCRFILVGPDSGDGTIEKVTQAVKRYPQNIFYYEGMDLEELYGMYRNIDFLICPSRDDPMPVVAAEAMSLGKPVICSCNTGTAKIVRRFGAGYTYGKNDPRKLAKLIKKAYCMQAAEYQKYSANARKAYEDVFSEEVFEKRVTSIMKDIIQKNETDERYSADDHTFAICAYKENPYLEECLASLMRQSIKGKMIICTSTPNAYIENIAKKYSIPLLVNDDPRGIGADWNFALRSADTELVTLAHQDDIYEPEFLEETLKSLNGAAKPQIAMTCCYENQGGRKVTHKDFINLRIKRWLLAPLGAKGLRSLRPVKRAAVSFANPVCCPSVTFVKNSLPDKLFNEDLKYSVDWEAWIRLSRREGSFVYIPRMLVGHRMYDGSSTMMMSGNGQRETEDRLILSAIWPKPVAALIYRFYSRSVKNRMEGKN